MKYEKSILALMVYPWFKNMFPEWVIYFKNSKYVSYISLIVNINVFPSNWIYF